MIMQNSYLRMSSNPKTSQLNIVQGDKSVIKFHLLDRRQTVMTGIDDELAEIRIFEGDTLRVYQESVVTQGEVSFSIEEVLAVGEHELRIKVGDFYFPSEIGTFVFNILPAHDLATDVDPAAVQTIDLVINSLRADIEAHFQPLLHDEAVKYFNENKGLFKGDKGDTTLVPPKVYTRAEYDALNEYDSNTLYVITDGGV